MAALDATPRAVGLRLVGEFELRGSERVLRVCPSAQRLLAFLALAGRPVRRSVVAGTLALQADEARAAARLRSVLWRVPRPDGAALVEATPRRVGLSPSVRVDYRQTEDAVAAGGVELGALAEDLLPDWDEDWVVVERERYRQARLHALEQVCARHRAAGEYDLALRAGLTAVSGEPLRESAHRQVVETHLAEGNPAEALRQYETFRRLLRTELGLPPSPAIRALVSTLLGRPVEEA